METERLIIDEIREFDREDYYKNISHDREVLKTFVCTYIEKIEDMDISKYIGRDDMFAIRMKDTKRLIGIILFFDGDGDSCEIGYGIGSEYWGMGYGTEAVKRFLQYCMDEKGFNTVYASFFTGNEASKRIMEKCGMTFDHFNEKELVYQGEEKDLTYYKCTKK